MRERMAIIGGGVAGLTAGYLLSRRYDVTLYEKQHRLGGNAYSLRTREGVTVDIAAAVFGRAGYPHFYRLLDELGVPTCASPGALMSFHDLDAGDGMYLTPRLSGLVSQRFKILSRRRLGAFWRAARVVARGRAQLRSGALLAKTVGELLAPLDHAARTIVLCSFCLLSSMSGAEVWAAPAAFFFEKLEINSDLLSPRCLYSLRAIKGSTQRYVEALGAPYRRQVVLGAQIEAVRRSERAVVVELAGGRSVFDHVIFACNPDQALALLDMPTPAERRLLGPWRYKDGRVVVHRDWSAMPRRELVQAYTFLHRGRAEAFETSVNGVLRYEPGVPVSCDLISSQHPNFPIRPSLIELDTVLRTPIFDAASCATVRALPSLNGHSRTHYCGSYFGHGLHEDAVRSAIELARDLGVEDARLCAA